MIHVGIRGVRAFRHVGSVPRVRAPPCVGAAVQAHGRIDRWARVLLPGPLSEQQVVGVESETSEPLPNCRTLTGLLM